MGVLGIGECGRFNQRTASTKSSHLPLRVVSKQSKPSCLNHSSLWASSSLPEIPRCLPPKELLEVKEKNLNFGNYFSLLGLLMINLG